MKALAQNIKAFLLISRSACYSLFCIFGYFVVPMGISPQGKPAVIESRYPTLINYKCVAGSFRASIIHRALTTWSLTCVRDHSYACVYTRELGTPTASQLTFLTQKKTLTKCSSAPDAGGVRTSGLWISIESDALPTEPPHPVHPVGRTTSAAVEDSGGVTLQKKTPSFWQTETTHAPRNRIAVNVSHNLLY